MSLWHRGKSWLWRNKGRLLAAGVVAGAVGAGLQQKYIWLSFFYLSPPPFLPHTRTAAVVYGQRALQRYLTASVEHGAARARRRAQFGQSQRICLQAGEFSQLLFRHSQSLSRTATYTLL